MNSLENLEKEALDVWEQYAKAIKTSTGLEADINQTEIYRIIEAKDEERLLKFINWFKDLTKLIEEAEPPFLSILQSPFV